MSARVRSGAGYGNADVGMDPSKEKSRRAVPEHPLEQLVAVVAGAQAVAVREEQLSTLDGQRQRLVGKDHPQLASQVITDPEIVISAEIRNRDTAAGQRSETRQDPNEAFRDGMAVFEPEIEEVSDDVKLRAFGADAVEEGQEVPLPGAARIFRALAQVGIGDEIGATRMGHGASV